jgi:hypothetical protein
VTLSYPAGSGSWDPPVVTWARVNNDIATLTTSTPPSVPGQTFFSRPAPNPARNAAAVTLGVSAREDGAHVKVVVVDAAGRLTRTLVDGPLAAGVYHLAWDLRDAGGNAAPAGVYMLRAQTGRFTAVHRVVVVH